MRLTLRTLLAYLDDILDAVQTKEIGARISENSVASSLIDRIRDVTRRRRIGSPDLTGPGSSPDPNVVAEYLDNTLEPAAVADLERVCLDSDVHLAEVAACHQILTIVLGEPVTIRPELRERMYAMGAVSPAPATGLPAPPMPYAVGSTPPASSRPVVPDYLKRPPLWRRLLPAAVLALAVFGGWFYLVSDFLGGTPPAGTVATAPPAKPAKPAPEAKPPAVRPAASTELAATTPPADPTPEPMPPAPLPMEPAPPADSALAAATPPAAANGAPLPPPPAPGLPAPEPSVDAPRAEPEPAVLYTSTDGILLGRLKGQNDWTVLPRRALLHVGDELASPEPFISDLQLSPPDDPTVALRVSLVKGTRIRLLPPTDNMLAELEIERGRLVVERPGDEVPHALGLGITVAGQRTEFDAVSPKTRYGIMVLRPQPNGEDFGDRWPSPSGTLFVTSGAVNVRRPNLPPLSGEPTAQSLEFTNPAADSYSPLTIAPPFLDDSARPLESEKSWARTFEREFKLDLPVQSNMRPIAEQDKRNTMSGLATSTAALIDDIPTLVSVLSSPHESTRSAAIGGLREWIGAARGNLVPVQEEVNRNFREQDAAAILKLLWGISAAEARDEVVSMQVVDWMASDNIAVRELAFIEAFKYVKRDFQYRPQNPLGQRETALTRFRELVRRNKGFLPPLPAAEPAANPDPAN